MITVNSFVTDSLNTVDAVISDFVHTVYTHFVQANAGLITLLFTLYVMILGYQFLNRSHHFDLSTVMRHIVVMLCVYGLVMNWQLYHLFVYNIFTSEPGHIAKTMMTASEKSNASNNIVQALDGIYSAIVNAAMGFLGQINFSVTGLVFILYAALIFIIGVLMCVCALLLFIYSKMMMAIALGLGPIFILFYLWDSTRGIFSAWLNILITIALIPVITSAILALMLSVVNVTLPNIQTPANDMQFYGIAPFLTLCLATTMILSQVFRICSALGGGITLASISTGVAIANSALRYSGMKAAGRGVMNWTGRQAKQLRQRMRGGK